MKPGIQTVQHDESFFRYQKERREHWDQIGKKMEGWKSWGEFYHKRLRQVYKLLISPGKRVLEIGCGNGDLLAALKPSYGLGIDFSEGMLKLAQARYPELHFMQQDAHDLDLDEKFDVIIL
jgi:ubiquinone/menaquinone biosynthesis C-methylase UbiE